MRWIKTRNTVTRVFVKVLVYIIIKKQIRDEIRARSIMNFSPIFWRYELYKSDVTMFACISTPGIW